MAHTIDWGLEESELERVRESAISIDGSESFGVREYNTEKGTFKEMAFALLQCGTHIEVIYLRATGYFEPRCEVLRPPFSVNDTVHMTTELWQLVLRCVPNIS